MRYRRLLIGANGGKRGRGIRAWIGERAHDVRRVRNYWAHEQDAAPRTSPSTKAATDCRLTCTSYPTNGADPAIGKTTSIPACVLGGPHLTGCSRRPLILRSEVGIQEVDSTE
jgi:hypothetical protein